MTHKGDAEQGNAEQIEDLCASMVHGGCTPNGSKHHSDKHYKVDNQTHVEGQTHIVGKEPLEPTTHLNNAWHNTIEHGCYQQHRHDKCHQRTFEFGFGLTLVVVNQRNGGQTEQVEQVYTN